MLLRALRVTARRGVRRLSTPVAPTPEAVCANIGVDHHEGALDQVFATTRVVSEIEKKHDLLYDGWGVD